MSSDRRMGMSEFLSPEQVPGVGMCEFLNNTDVYQALPPMKESYNYNHGIPSGPPMSRMNLVPGPPGHSYYDGGPVVPVCGPPMHDGCGPPLSHMHHMAHPASMHQPHPLPHPMLPHHHPQIINHGHPPHHMHMPPSHHYGIPHHIESQSHLPPVTHIMPHPPSSIPPSFSHVSIPNHVQPQVPQKSPARPPLPKASQSKTPRSRTSQAKPLLPKSSQAPPPLPISETAPPPPLPPDSEPPPLPPLPPLPPEEQPKPPPPKDPPPSPIKETHEIEVRISSGQDIAKASKEKLSAENTNDFDDEPKPIPSIVTSRKIVKPASGQSTNSSSRQSFPVLPPVLAAVVSSVAPTKDSTPSPPPLPAAVAVRKRSNLVTVTEDAYDPEDATFSPTSSRGSPPAVDSSDESPVKQPCKNLDFNQDSSPIKDQEVNGRDRKKRVSFSEEVLFAEKGNKVPTESPVRLDLDARLKNIFGGASDEEKSPKKAKKSHGVVKVMKEEDNITRPLSPTPSPFLSRPLYLYWHKETLKARQESGKPIHVDVAPIQKNTPKAVPKVNGQVGPVALPPKGMPPLPKNLPTVPPPNYKCSMTSPLSLKEGNLKLEMLKNMKRMHPYKLNEKVTCLKNPPDTELELTSAPPSDSGEETSQNSSSQEETVRLVMEKILEEFRCYIRRELTKDLITGSSKVEECLKNYKNS